MQPDQTIKTAAFAVRRYGEFLATRAAGRTARNDLDEVLRASPGATIVVSFAGVNAMTIGFADEFLGCFYSSLASSDPHPAGVLLDGLNAENTETVAVCLERRDLIAAAVAGPHGQLVLLGNAGFLQASFRQAAALGTFTAAAFSAALNITPQNANNRLKRLTGAGAVSRGRVHVTAKSGKEFAYQCVTAPGVA
jgi:hypothetical protein